MPRIRTYPLAAAALLLCLLLSGCTPSSGREDADRETAAPRGTEPADNIAAYEALIADLRDELLREKAEKYISDAAYQVRLAALEQALALYESDFDAGTRQPVAGSADETEPGADALPASVTDPVDLSEREKSAGQTAFRFTVTEETVTITAYLGSGRSVSIPPVINGYPVTAVAEGAFRDTFVTSVTLPDSLVQIGWFAFAGCEELTSVVIPASVISIGYGAFDGCTRLTVTAPSGSYAAGWASSYGLHVTSP